MPLHADDAHLGRDVAQKHPEAGEQPRAADGHEHRAQRGQLLENLERGGALSGDDIEILRRAHEGNRLPLGVRHREHERGFVVGGRRVDGGAECGDPVALHVGSGGRDVERRGNRELARGVGDAESVVAGGGGDYSPRARSG